MSRFSHTFFKLPSVLVALPLMLGVGVSAGGLMRRSLPLIITVAIIAVLAFTRPGGGKPMQTGGMLHGETDTAREARSVVR